MKKQLTNFALILGSAIVITSCGETKDALDNAVDATKDAATNAVDATKEAATDAVDATKDAASSAAESAKEIAADTVDVTKDATSSTVEAVTEAVTPDTAGADTQEKVIDDAMALMEEGLELMTSGDPAAMDVIQKKATAIEERAKALDLDMNNLPDDLKAKMEAKAGELQGKAEAMMAEKMKSAVEAQQPADQ